MPFHDQGSLEAFAFPALNHMISQWVPEKEKSAFVSFAYVGGTFGSIITNPICGLIIPALGWQVRTILDFFTTALDRRCSTARGALLPCGASPGSS